MSVIKLLASVGLGDWRRAAFAGQPATSFPSQVRLFSNGAETSFIHVVNGMVVAAGSTQAAYDSEAPITKIWPMIQPRLRAGAALIYFGGLHNQCEIGKEDDALPEWVRKTSSGQYAFVRHSLKRGQVLAATKITNDLNAAISECVRFRVPFEVYDEASACLAQLTAAGSHFPPSPDLQLCIILFRHIVYGCFCQDGQLLNLGETPLRHEDYVDLPNFSNLMNRSAGDLATADSSKTTDDVKRVLVVDLTSAANHQENLHEYETTIHATFPAAKCDVISPAANTATFLKTIESLHPEAACFRNLETYPLPLAAFWPTS